MNDILKFLIGTTGVSVVVIFLGKFILYFLRDIGVEKYKTNLDKEIIKYQSKLDEKVEKFKISYSNLFVEQIVIMKETYKKLIVAEKPLEYLMRPIKTSPVKPEDEIAKEVIDKANDLFDYFDENELMFNEKISETFNLIREKYVEVWNTFTTKEIFSNSISSEMLLKLTKDMQNAYNKTLQGEIQTLKKQLRDEFQKQLGIFEEELIIKTVIDDNT